MSHTIKVVAIAGGMAWVCECGKAGVPVKDLAGANGRVFLTAAERARDAGQRHVDSAPPSWPFPPSSYDYERYGVGMRSRPTEADKAEVERVIKFWRKEVTS